MARQRRTQEVYPWPPIEGGRFPSHQGYGVHHGMDWSKCSFPILGNILMDIKTTPILLLANVNDRLAWISSPNGDFDSKDAYNIACSIAGKLDNGQFKKANTNPKIQCFLWQCCHESVSVRFVLVTRGINISETCSMCNSSSKSIDHLLRVCPFTKTFWESLSPPMHANYFYGTNLMDWLRLNCCSLACYGPLGIAWNIIFPIRIWCLWLRRNRVVFNNTKPFSYLRVEVLAKTTKFVFVGANYHGKPTKSTIQVKWLPPSIN